MSTSVDSAREQEVLAQLRTIQDPDLQKDFVTLGMIRDLELDELVVEVRERREVGTGPPPERLHLELVAVGWRQAREQVEHALGRELADVGSDVRVHGRRQATAG